MNIKPNLEELDNHTAIPLRLDVKNPCFYIRLLFLPFLVLFVKMFGYKTDMILVKLLTPCPVKRAKFVLLKLNLSEY